MNEKPGTYISPGGGGKPRLYLRHPADVPIVVDAAEDSAPGGTSLRDAGLGGLCFQSEAPYAQGTRLDITIPVSKPPFSAHCEVAWCRPSGDHFEIGVAFCDQGKDHLARMVEQICHIEHYRHQVREQEGRELSPQEAALEWIQKFAEAFPRP